MHEAVARRPNRMNVMVVDDHPIIRDGIAEAIEQRLGMTVLIRAGSSQAALDAMREHAAVDVAIVDVNLGEDNGLKLVGKILADYPRVAVLVLSFHHEIPYAQAAFRAGAQGYLSKQASTDELLRAVQRVADGGMWYSAGARVRLTPRPRADDDAQAFALTELTGRELSVFEHIGRGQTSQEIAASLGVGRKTVDTYRERIKMKLGIENATQLVRAAVRWVDEDGHT